MKLRVRCVSYEAEGILSFELVHPEGQRLPAFEAGAHIDVRTPGGLSRRYSLCSRPGETGHYRIAVLNVPDSRGGSRAMHERVRAGDLLEISEPHNFFPLNEKAEMSMLLAGGIGITPLLAMVERLQQEGGRFQLHYCTQTPKRTAFAQHLASLVADGVVHLHHDHGDYRNGLDIATLLRDHKAGTHLYYCGPTGFMKAVKAAAAHWPAEAVHYEYFGAEPTAASGGQASEIRLVRSERSIQIAPEQTILQALREAGVHCESSCESGVCGTCLVGYSAGEPEHHDVILGEEERRTQVLVCCARVKQGPLVLDI